ncbi:MAG: hypothetical protein ACK4N5_12225 [Myxococcales bacterium]
MTPTDLTVQILREIRDEIRSTNARLDQTNARLEGLEKRVVGLEVRTVTEFTALAAAVNDLSSFFATSSTSARAWRSASGTSKS